MSGPGDALYEIQSTMKQQIEIQESPSKEIESPLEAEENTDGNKNVSVISFNNEEATMSSRGTYSAEEDQQPIIEKNQTKRIDKDSAIEATRTTAMTTLVSTETQSSRTSNITLGKVTVPNIVCMMKKKHDITFKSIVDEFARDIGVITNQLQFMTRHQIKERSAEMIVNEAYYNTPQAREYIAHRCILPPPQRRPTSSSNKPQETRTNKPQEFNRSKLRAPTSTCPRQRDLGSSSKLEQTPSNNPIKFEFRAEGDQIKLSWNTKLFLAGGSGARKTFGSAGEGIKRTTKNKKRKTKTPSRKHTYVKRV